MKFSGDYYVFPVLQEIMSVPHFSGLLNVQDFTYSWILFLLFTVIQVYASTINAEEAEVEQFYEDHKTL